MMIPKQDNAGGQPGEVGNMKRNQQCHSIPASNLCLKWEKCNAPICPLDPDWNKRVFNSEDAVCFYMTEAVKTDAQATFERRGHVELFKLMSESIQPISARWATISARLERSKLSGSRMAREAPWLNRGE
jgi:hypothetical protein